MKFFGTQSFRIALVLASIACVVVAVLFLRLNIREKPPDYAVQLKSKNWDTTITGQYTVADIDSKEMLPILILELAVANRTDKDFLLNCNLLQSDDNLKTIQDIYFPFWALNIKREDDLRLVRIPSQATETGKMAFQLERTAKSLWLDCGSDVKVRVQ